MVVTLAAAPSQAEAQPADATRRRRALGWFGGWGSVWIRAPFETPKQERTPALNAVKQTRSSTAPKALRTYWIGTLEGSLKGTLTPAKPRQQPARWMWPTRVAKSVKAVGCWVEGVRGFGFKVLRTMRVWESVVFCSRDLVFYVLGSLW